jgi:hypothetical protein
MSRARHAAAGAGVRRRHVLFFGGFDPKGVMYYHALYQRHARLQAEAGGLALDAGPRQRDAAGHSYWLVRSGTADSERCESRIECIGWDALVRRHWPARAWQLVREMLLAYARILGHGAAVVPALLRRMPRTMFALFFPLMFFVVGALACLLLAFAMASSAAALGMHAAVAGVLAVAVLVVSWRALLAAEKRLETGLLVRIFSFITRYAVGHLPELDREIERAAARIVAVARAGECDELLVIGYSVGSILASRALAQALEQLAGDEAAKPAIALLTLGNCIPLLGLFPQAALYRTELQRLGESDALRWVDICSPTDWASTAMRDPLELCGISARQRGAGWPQVVSPRFHTLFSAVAYRGMRRNKHQVHTQYLMATEKAGRYDYFAITAGPLALADRFPARRKERP